MAHQRSGLHGHTADSTEATGGGKGAENHDEAETSKLFEGTGSVIGEVDGDVKDLWARVKELEALVHALQVAARDDIETLPWVPRGAVDLARASAGFWLERDVLKHQWERQNCVCSCLLSEFIVLLSLILKLVLI
nr:hypothetical protein Iba_chr14dCG2030 [Ipomoea batatas]